MANHGFTAVFQKVPEGYVGFVEEFPSATLDEARENLFNCPGGELPDRRGPDRRSISDSRTVCPKSVVKRIDLIRHPIGSPLASEGSNS